MSTDLELIRIAKRLESRGETELVASVQEITAKVTSKMIDHHNNRRWNQMEQGKKIINRHLKGIEKDLAKEGLIFEFDHPEVIEIIMKFVS